MLSSITRFSKFVVNHGDLTRRTLYSGCGFPSGFQEAVSPLRTTESDNINQQVRWKHSERQIKRLFRNHPAKIRVEARLGVDRTPAALDPPRFQPIFEPAFLPNGWSAPPGPDISVPEYPFQVKRTKNKPNDAVGFLPVYPTFRKDGSRVTTRIKKVTGDRELFVKELRAALQFPAPKNGDARLDPIRIRVGGAIEVKGNKSREIKHWLAGLGF